MDLPRLDRQLGLGERTLPGEDVRVHGVDERAVEVEDQRTHADSMTARSSALAPERPDLDRPHLGDRVCGRDLDGFLQAAALDQVESAEGFFGRDERTVCDQCLPVADADRAGAPRRRQLVAYDPGAPRLELVEPGEALLVRRI